MGVESGMESSKPITLKLFKLRDREVILDCDLAALYGIPTKQLNQHVKRHAARFPEDFAFLLTHDEWKHVRELQSRSGHRSSRHAPHAFTEQGVMMLASMLRRRTSIPLSIEIVRAFARSRRSEYGLADLRLDEPPQAKGDDKRPTTYFIRSGPHGPIKIGVTTNFSKRFRGLALTSPVELLVLGTVPMNIERECHAALAKWRLHGEWFKPAPEVLAFIRQRLATRRRLN